MKKKNSFYYGWIVILGAFVSCGMMTYVAMNSFSLFVAPVTSTLGITATAFLVCASLRSLASVISGPIGGKMLDTKGIRFSVIVFAAIMTVGYVVLIFAKNTSLFYVGYFIVGLSAGSTTSINNAACSRWFDKHRGLANSIASAGNGLISFILSPVLAAVIKTSGYNIAYAIIAGLVLVCSLIIGALLIRDDPREMGLLPDGAQEEKETNTTAAGNVELPGLTMQEVYKTKSFWFMAVGLGVFTISSLGIVQTWNASFQGLGIDAVTVAFAVSVYGIACIPAKLIFGFMTDKLSLRTVTVIGFGLFAAAAMLLGSLKTPSVFLLYVFAVAFAIGNSSWQPLFIKYIVNSFGLKSVGSVSGIISMFMNIGGMVGPLIAGAFFDMSGIYNMAYYIFAGFAVLCLILMLMTRDETSGRG